MSYYCVRHGMDDILVYLLCIDATGIKSNMRVFVSTFDCNLMYQCPPFSVADQRLQEPPVLNCAHGQSLRVSYVRTGYSDPLRKYLSCTPLPHPPRRYSPDQILAIQAATPDPSLTSRLRDLSIGCLPRKPSSRGERRKQRKIAVVCDGAARLTTQPPNDLLQRPFSARRSVSNSITVVPPPGDQ